MPSPPTDAPDAPPQSVVVDVLAPVAVDTAYSYRAPPGMRLEPGAFVRMPLGARLATGVVWSTRPGGGDNLKPIAEVLDWPPLRAPLRDFIDWAARWTLSPRGMLLRMAIRAGEAAAPPAPKFGLIATGKTPTRMTEARARVLAALAESGGAPTPKAALAARAACSTSVIDGLVADGALAAIELAPESAAAPLDPDFRSRPLNADQRAAADDLTGRVGARAFSATLLEGVTGSGKTEVYFEAVAEALRQGRQALVLLPEIALTGQFLDRFAARFGARPAEWHSGLTERQRARVWSAAASGEARAVVGARSALFLPFADLGLIVVDEEHEGAYKQEEGVIYNARDMGVVRARLEKAPIVLASATPAIETRFNAQSGRYHWLRLPSRFGAARLPEIALVDLKREGPPRGRWLSPRADRCGRGGAREGRAGDAVPQPARLCAPHPLPRLRASLPMPQLRRPGWSSTGFAASSSAIIAAMPSAGRSFALSATRPTRSPPAGRGSSAWPRRRTLLFPDIRTLVLSSDTPGGIETLRGQLDAAARGAYDLIIGTQLVAKGHNFPHPDLRLRRRRRRRPRQRRSARGRAHLPASAPGDRARRTRRRSRDTPCCRPGSRSIRSSPRSCPATPSGSTAKRPKSGAVGGLPPFGRLAAIIVSAEDRGAAEAHARALAQAAHRLPQGQNWRVAPLGGQPHENEIILLGPAEAPIAVLRKRHRFRLAAKAPRSADLQGFLRAMLAAAPEPRGGVRVAIDVDPQSFL